MDETPVIPDVVDPETYDPALYDPEYTVESSIFAEEEQAEYGYDYAGKPSWGATGVHVIGE